MKKLIKRTVCAVTSAAMLCTAAPYVFASEADTAVQTSESKDAALDSAIAIARTKIDIPPEYSEFSNGSSSQFGINCYNMTWSVPGDERSISVYVNSKGDVVGMRNFSPQLYSRESMSIPKVSEDAAKSSALGWLEAVNPSWISQLDIDGAKAMSYSLYSSDYSVRFQRIVNGVPVSGNSVYIEVNKNDGTVTEMNAEWVYPTSFADISGTISQSEAQAKLIENSPLELSYRTGDSHNAVLSYSPKERAVQINALDGKLIDRTEEYKRSLESGAGDAPAASVMQDMAVDGEAENTAAKYSYTEKELEALEQNAKLITPERAMEIFRGIKNIEAEKYTLARHSYRSDKDSETGKTSYSIALSLNYSDKDNDRITYMNVTLDAESGELKYLSSYGDYFDEEADKNYNADSAKKIADEFAKEYAPNEYSKVKADYSEFEDLKKSGDFDYYIPAVRFSRWENEIIFPENFVMVKVNAKGIVTYFNKAWDNDVKFESPDGILTAEEAAEKLFEQNPAMLTYEDFSSYRSASYNILPIYSFGDKSCKISAKSGSLLNYDNTEYSEKDEGTKAYERLTDISGHYSENAVKTLLYYGVLSLDEDETTFRPDDVMTQAELLAFVGTLSGDDQIRPERDIYSSALRRSVIHDYEIDSAKQATRADAAQFIVRAIGFSEVAELAGIFNCGFNDRESIPDGFEGYVAIAKGLNIVRGDESNNFNPNETITRGDAAIMIYNYLMR